MGIPDQQILRQIKRTLSPLKDPRAMPEEELLAQAEVAREAGAAAVLSTGSGNSGAAAGASATSTGAGASTASVGAGATGAAAGAGVSTVSIGTVAAAGAGTVAIAGGGGDAAPTPADPGPANPPTEGPDPVDPTPVDPPPVDPVPQGINGTPGNDVLQGTADADTINGLAGNDLIMGQGGDDTINGGDGDDTLEGGAGADTLRGGAGNDVYRIDEQDTVVELANEGVDQVLTSLLSYTLGANVENLAFVSLGDFLGTGNELDNLIESGPGNDALSGLGGNDTLNAGQGDDNLDGGAGNDTLIGGQGNDTLNGGDGDDVFVIRPGEGTDTIQDFAPSIDKIDISAFNITYAEDFLMRVLIAQDGTSTRITIDSGFDANGDPEDGATMLLENTSANLVSFADFITSINDPLLQIGTVFVDTLNGTADADSLYGLAGHDTLIGMDGDDTIDGGDGNDTINGGLGGDYMIGGAGDDYYFVDSLFDAVIEAPGQGFDTVDTTRNNYTMGAFVERLIFSGTGGAVLTGSSADNVIIGGDGNDLLNGAGGTNTLTGGSGDDVLTTILGNDTLVFGSNFGDDLVIGFDSDPAGGQDLIDIKSFNIFDPASFSARVTIADAAGSTLITISDGVSALGDTEFGGTILLDGVSVATVTMDDFVMTQV